MPGLHPIVQCPVSSEVMLPPAAWKLCQTFLVHGLTVAAVLNSHEWMHLPRDLDCVEIFAGVGPLLQLLQRRACAPLRMTRGASLGSLTKQRISPLCKDLGEPLPW